MLIDKELTDQIIGAAIEVHRQTGPGLLESAYQRFLAREFEIRCIAFAKEVPLPVSYKGVSLDCGYRMDFVVEGRVVVEVKAIEKIAPIHEAQLITYLKLSGHRVGLLINFNAPTIKNNYIRKVV
jgi:GxxExxY protein